MADKRTKRQPHPAGSFFVSLYLFVPLCLSALVAIAQLRKTNPISKTQESPQPIAKQGITRKILHAPRKNTNPIKPNLSRRSLMRSQTCRGVASSEAGTKPIPSTQYAIRNTRYDIRHPAFDICLPRGGNKNIDEPAHFVYWMDQICDVFQVTSFLRGRP